MNQEELQKQLENRFKMAISTCSSIAALNINGRNVPIIRHRMSDWIKKQEPVICCLQEIQCRGKTHKDLNQGNEKDTSYKWNWRESKGSDTHSRQNKF